MENANIFTMLLGCRCMPLTSVRTEGLAEAILGLLSIQNQFRSRGSANNVLTAGPKAANLSTRSSLKKNHKTKQNQQITRHNKNVTLAFCCLR